MYIYIHIFFLNILAGSIQLIACLHHSDGGQEVKSNCSGLDSITRGRYEQKIPKHVGCRAQSDGLDVL